jgi:uncharacterized protein (DUF885 family)
MTTENTNDSVHRFTVVSDKEHKAKLDVIAKQYKITQGEVIEVMLDNGDFDQLDPFLQAKRAAKVSGREKLSETKSKLLDKLKDLSPEALERLLAQVQL